MKTAENIFKLERIKEIDGVVIFCDGAETLTVQEDALKDPTPEFTSLNSEEATEAYSDWCCKWNVQQYGGVTC